MHNDNIILYCELQETPRELQPEEQETRDHPLSMEPTLATRNGSTVTQKMRTVSTVNAMTISMRWFPSIDQP